MVTRYLLCLTLLVTTKCISWFFSDCFALQMFAMESVAASILTVPSIVKLTSPLILLKHRLYRASICRYLYKYVVFVYTPNSHG